MESMAFLRNVNLRTLVLLHIGAAIQAGPALILVAAFTEIAPYTVTTVPTLGLQSFAIFLIVTFVLGIVYCYFATFAFPVKRFFSPLYLQGVTIAYLSPVYLVLRLLVASESRIYLDIYTLLEQWTLFIVLVIGFLLVMSIIQFPLVRILVGRDGVEDAITCAGYETNVPYEKFMTSFLSLKEHPLFGWIKKADRGLYQVFRYLEYGDESVILLVAPTGTKSGTRLVFATFSLMPTTILKSPFAKEMLNESVNLMKKSMHCRLTRLNADDALFGFAKKEGLSPTRPAWFGWTRITTSTRGMFVGLCLMLLLFSALYFSKVLDQSYYITFLLFAALDFVVVVVPAVLEKVRETSVR
jgi:hypothetical protein